MASRQVPDHLPPEVLTRPDLIDACAQRDLGAIFRIARKWAGFSPSHLSRRCQMTISRVTDYTTGRTLAQSVEVFTRVADGLHIPGANFGLAPRPWEQADILPPTRIEPSEIGARVAGAVENDRLDQPVLDYLARALAEHRRMEDQLGSHAMLPVVTTQYRMLTRLIRFAAAPIHDPALSLAAQYSQFLTWMYHDQKDDIKARELYSLAETQAQEAGDATMAACVLSMKAHLEWGDANPLACVRFAQAAQWSAPITPAARGMAAQMEARGLALLKDATNADRKTAEATDLLTRASDHWEDEPPWLYFYEGPWVTLQTGSTQLDLGRPTRAIDLLSGAIARLDPAYIRDAAWYRAILSRAHLAAADIDQAAAAALAVLPDARATNAYATDHLTATSAMLNRRAPHHQAVRELAEALAG